MKRGIGSLCIFGIVRIRYARPETSASFDHLI